MIRLHSLHHSHPHPLLYPSLPHQRHALSEKKMDREPEPEELVQDPYCQTYIPRESAIRKRSAGIYFAIRMSKLSKIKKS